MKLHFPWHRSEASRQRFVMTIAILGSALASSPVIRLAMHGEHIVAAAHVPVACTLSTAMWTWLFLRLFRKPSRSTLHFIWLAPLLGALNAGSSFALANLIDGQGPASALQSVLVGTVFGTFYGGGPLGFLFGAMLAGFIAFARPLVRSADGDAPLQLLLGAATWLTTAGVLTVIADAHSDGPVRWAPIALLIAAGAVGLGSLATHATAWRWTRRLRADLLPNYTLSRGEGHFGDQVFWRDRRAEGPFRSADLTAAIGSAPRGAPPWTILHSATLVAASALMLLLIY